MTEAVIELAGVSKVLKGNPILDDVSLSIPRGSSRAVVGPNGAGKSVLLRLLSGLTVPSSGIVTFHPEFKRGGRRFPDYFGVMIDGPAYVPGFSAMKNLDALVKIRRRATRDDCRTLLTELGLDPDSRKPARSFSLGMKQKLGLAQALIEDPKVLILDEPFNALDAESVTQLTDRLSEFTKGGGTLIFTSHRNDDVLSLADTVLEIENGKVTELD